MDRKGNVAYLHDTRPNLTAPMTIKRQDGRTIRLLLLTEQQAENCWKIRIAGQDRLLITSADLFSDGARITLRSLGKREFRFSLFPGLASGQRLVASSALRTTAFRGGLQEYTAELPPANASLTLHPIRRAGIAPPVPLGPAVSWRPHSVAMAPTDATFQASAATWDLRVSWPRRTEISDLFLTVDYLGDVALLLTDGHLLIDDFYNGQRWQVGLRRYQADGTVSPLTLQILPLRSDAPIFLEPAVRAGLPHTSQVDQLKAISVVPQYQLQLEAH